MEPLKRLFEILPFDYAASFIVEIGRQNDSQKLTELFVIYSDSTPENILLEWFNWKNSRQGSDYWHEVYQYVLDRTKLV